MSFYTVSHRTHMSCIGSHVICCRHILPPWIGIKAFFLKIHGTRKARAHSGELSPHCWHRPATHATRPVAGVRHLPAWARTAVPLHRSTADAAVQRDSLPLTCGLYSIFFLTTNQLQPAAEQSVCVCWKSPSALQRRLIWLVQPLLPAMWGRAELLAQSCGIRKMTLDGD